MQDVAEKRDLRKHCRFHTSVDKAEWDANANVWRLEIRDVRTGEKQVTRATALVSAIGVLVIPSFPKLQGIESFKGEVFHSARWNHDVDLHGKRVAVVGNGSSAYVNLFTYLSGILNVALIVNPSLQGTICPKDIHGPNCQRRKLRAHSDVVYTVSRCPSLQQHVSLP